MGKTGIATYEAVEAAADQILATGRNPTVAAIREALDGGSPNTVLKHLDRWRVALGERFLALRDAGDTPASLREHLVDLWREARAQADEVAQGKLGEAQQALETERTALRAREAERQQQEASLRAEVDRLRQALDSAASTATAQAERLVQAREDLQAEQARTRKALDDVAGLSAELATQTAAVDTLSQNLRAQREAEDEAHASDLARIDGLVQELRRTKAQLASSEKAREAAIKQAAGLAGRVKAMETAQKQQAGQLTAAQAALAQLARKSAASRAGHADRRKTGTKAKMGSGKR